MAVVPEPSQEGASDGTFEMRVTEALGEEEDAPRDGSAQSEVVPTALPDANVEAILARLPALEEEATDRADFALREKSQKAPKSGATELIPFPPSYSPEKPDSASNAAIAAAAGDLEVVRCSPMGDVSVAGTVNVTFSQPMVELGTVDDVAGQRVPVKITPQPEGSFRWVGTQTVLFEPTYRMPMATNYTVEVGPCASVLGKKLPKVEKFEFSTPPVTLGRHAVTAGPGERLLALSFDQRVDAKAVLAHLSATYGSGSAKVRLFTEGDREQFAKEHELFSKKCQNGTNFPATVAMMDKAEESTCVGVIISAVEPDQKVTVTLKKGLPCLEGPRVTEKDQSIGYRTHLSFRITDKPLTATSRQQFSVRFSNPLDCEVLHPEEGDGPVLVRMEPPVEDLECYVSSANTLCLSGDTKGDTYYTVTVCTTVVDIYGQHLPKEESFTVVIMPLKPQLTAFRSGLYTLDPFAKPGEKNFSYNVMATNVKQVRYAVWQVDPAKDFATSPYSMNSGRHVNRDYKSKKPSDYFKGGKLVREWVQNTGCETDVAKVIS